MRHSRVLNTPNSRELVAQSRDFIIFPLDLSQRGVEHAARVYFERLYALFELFELAVARRELEPRARQLRMRVRSRIRRRVVVQEYVTVQNVDVVLKRDAVMVRHEVARRAKRARELKTSFPHARSMSLDVERANERALQAIVLADSFANAFKPLTETTPKALMTIGRAEALAYVLEWLAREGARDIVVFACAHAEAIEQYVKKYNDQGKEKGGVNASGVNVSVIASANCASAGEALRVIDHKHVIRSDFILVHGDVVTNMDLTPALRAHRERRMKEKGAIVTMCVRKVGADARELLYGDVNLTLAMDAETNRIVHYEEHGGGTSNAPGLNLDASLFGEVKNIRVRTDLMDCHVDICAPEFLMLFTDNFDYQHIRKDFIVGTLNERELGNTVYGYEISPREYAARVHNLRSYDAVSRDVLNRWVYPYVPDTRVVPANNPETYRHEWGNNYFSPTCVVAADAEVKKGCLIGAHSTIGSGTVLTHSVIGKNVVIGANCTLDGAYVQDGARIGDGVTVTRAYVSENVVVHRNARVTKGCVLGSGVVIGAGFVMKPKSRVSLTLQPEMDGEEYDSDDSAKPSTSLDDANTEHVRDEAIGEHTPAQIQATLISAQNNEGVDTSAIWHVSTVGVGGAGYMWAPHEEGWRRSIAPSQPREPYDCAPEYAEEEARRGVSASRASASAVTALDGSVASDSEDDGDVRRESIFQREVAETFLRCVKQGYAQENAVVELQGLKMAENRTFADIARYVLMTIIGLALPAHSKTSRENIKLYPETAPTSTSELLKRLRERLREWAPLLARFLRSEDDQVEALLTLEEFCLEDEVFRGMGGGACVPSFTKVLHMLYDMDVISEESVIAWAEEKAEADEGDKKFLKLAQPFIDWLKEASEDEESSEDESESS